MIFKFHHQSGLSRLNQIKTQNIWIHKKTDQKTESKFCHVSTSLAFVQRKQMVWPAFGCAQHFEIFWTNKLFIIECIIIDSPEKMLVAKRYRLPHCWRQSFKGFFKLNKRCWQDLLSSNPHYLSKCWNKDEIGGIIQNNFLM